MWLPVFDPGSRVTGNLALPSRSVGLRPESPPCPETGWLDFRRLLQAPALSRSVYQPFWSSFRFAPGSSRYSGRYSRPKGTAVMLSLETPATLREVFHAWAAYMRF